jgi:hypothetical protein
MQLLDWKRGDFKFYGGDEVSYEDGFEPITVEEVLARGTPAPPGPAAAAPAQAVAAAPTGDSIYSRVSPPPQRVRVLDEAPEGGGPRDGSGIWVSRDEKIVLDRLDGRRNLAEVGRETKLGTARVLRAIDRLLEAGLAHPGGADAAAAVPPEPAAAAGAASATVPGAARSAQVRAPGRTATGVGAPTSFATASPAPAPPGAGSPVSRRPPAVAPPAAGEALRLDPLQLDTGAGVAARPSLEDSQSRAARPAGPRPVAVPSPPPRAAAAPVPSWPGVALASGLLILAMVVTAARPGLLLLPYPWQEAARESLEKLQRSSLYFKIDRAAKTFFLLEGHYPDDLDHLAGLRLLGGNDLRDPRGRPLAYATAELSYTLQPVEGGEPLADLGRREAVTGDFLLDAEFTKLPARSETQALVLLD